MVLTVTPERLKLGQVFGLRIANAMRDYDIAGELEVTLVVTMRSETVLIRLERDVDEGLVYLEKNVFYEHIGEAGDQAFKAMSLASELLAALLLKEGP